MTDYRNSINKRRSRRQTGAILGPGGEVYPPDYGTDTGSDDTTDSGGSTDSGSDDSGSGGTDSGSDDDYYYDPKTPNISVSEVEILDGPFQPGDSGRIRVTISNSGDGSGSQTYTAKSNGQAIGTVGGHVYAYDARVDTLNATAPSQSTWRVTAGGEAASVTVNPPDPEPEPSPTPEPPDDTNTDDGSTPTGDGATQDMSLSYVDLWSNPSGPVVGDTITLGIAVRNDHDYLVQKDLAITVNGEDHGHRSVSLSPTEQTSIEVDVIPHSAGTLNAKIGKADFGIAVQSPDSGGDSGGGGTGGGTQDPDVVTGQDPDNTSGDDGTNGDTPDEPSGQTPDNTLPSQTDKFFNYLKENPDKAAIGGLAAMYLLRR